MVEVDLFTKTDIPEEFDSFQNTSNPLQIANETLNNQTNYGAFKIFEEAKLQQQEDESLQESPSKEIKSFTCALLIPYMNSMLRLNTEQCLRKFGFKSVNYLDEEEEVIDFINNAKRMKQKLHLLIVPGDIGSELNEALSEIQNQCIIIGIQPISKENSSILQKNIKEFDEKYLKKALSEVF